MRIEFLGRKHGRLRELQSLLGQVEPAARPVVGKQFNEAKTKVEGAFEARKSELARPKSVLRASKAPSTFVFASLNCFPTPDGRRARPGPRGSVARADGHASAEKLDAHPLQGGRSPAAAIAAAALWFAWTPPMGSTGLA